MKRALAFAPLALALALVIAAAVLLSRGGARDGFGDTGLVGQPAPAYALPALSGGGDVTPADMAGRAYVLNVFASWCAPCAVEHPHLMRLAAQGVPILGVAYKDKPEDAQAFLDRLGDPFERVGLDRPGRYGIEIGVLGVPETFVIGPDGMIRAVHRGPLTPEAIESTIKPALGAQAPP